ncbi:MAG: hypothetical protein BWY76_03365 [bacterium ADurb.Bin429]|nr:MAG: hypothetical protein BWY76_03365 [bacterium ADurb.Bin429]
MAVSAIHAGGGGSVPRSRNRIFRHGNDLAVDVTQRRAGTADDDQQAVGAVELFTASKRCTYRSGASGGEAYFELAGEGAGDDIQGVGLPRAFRDGDAHPVLVRQRAGAVRRQNAEIATGGVAGVCHPHENRHHRARAIKAVEADALHVEGNAGAGQTHAKEEDSQGQQQPFVTHPSAPFRREWGTTYTENYTRMPSWRKEACFPFVIFSKFHPVFGRYRFTVPARTVATLPQ